MVGLLFKTHLRSAHHDPLSRFRYGDHPEFDEYIDNDYGPFEVLGASLLASEALYRIDFQAYRLALVEFHQEQKAEPADDEQGRESE